MNRLERLYKIHDLLSNARHPVPMRQFIDALGATRNTVTRDFEYLRDFFAAPIVYDRERNGHHYDPQAPVFELPGLWMNASELYALLACEQLLESVSPGLMAPRLAPLKQRIRTLLGDAGHDAEAVSQRIHIQPVQARQTNPATFAHVASATLAARELTFVYQSRTANSARQRQVAPQRLLHYRSNWYLLAYCQQGQALRLFSLDRISAPVILDTPATRETESELDTHSATSFGIFGGAPQDTAHLLFSRFAAQWVAEETWHPNQQGYWGDDGYHLHVPYSVMTELVMDILRYGSDVEVLAPPSLRHAVAGKVKEMNKRYWSDGK